MCEVRHVHSVNDMLLCLRSSGPEYSLQPEHCMACSDNHLVQPALLCVNTVSFQQCLHSSTQVLWDDATQSRQQNSLLSQSQ